jgi:hypothetical protein
MLTNFIPWSTAGINTQTTATPIMNEWTSTAKITTSTTTTTSITYTTTSTTSTSAYLTTTMMASTVSSYMPTTTHTITTTETSGSILTTYTYSWTHFITSTSTSTTTWSRRTETFIQQLISEVEEQHSTTTSTSFSTYGNTIFEISIITFKHIKVFFNIIVYTLRIWLNDVYQTIYKIIIFPIEENVIVIVEPQVGEVTTTTITLTSTSTVITTTTIVYGGGTTFTITKTETIFTSGITTIYSPTYTIVTTETIYGAPMQASSLGFKGDVSYMFPISISFLSLLFLSSRRCPLLHKLFHYFRRIHKI